MENHRCKLCFRKFVNGKALGGHMRSHTMNSRPEDDEEGKGGLLSSLFSVYQDRDLVCGRSEIMGKSRIKMEGFLLDEEADECLSPPLGSESLSSSVSDVTHEEDAAHCLIMLSRDKRRDEVECPTEGKEKKSKSQDSCLEKVMKNKARAKYYRCEICSKLFRSFQALGGHRASHNKIRVNTRDSGGDSKSTTMVLERTIACPLCPRVFTSGQAFGGHKRTHFIAATPKTIAVTGSIPGNGECFDIDLNLPPSFDQRF